MSHIVNRLADCTDQLCQPGAPFEVIKDSSSHFSIFKNAPATLRDLIDAGRQHGDQEFLVYQGERLTFTQFFKRVDALSYHLIHSLGINNGDRVAIAMRNCPEWMVSYAAIVSVGAVVVPLNSWGSADELHYGLKDSAAKLVFCDQQRSELIQSFLSKLNCQAIVARIAQGDIIGDSDFDEIIANNWNKPLPAVSCNTDDIAQIMYTSGTTGRPKGAVSSHKNICQAIYSFEFHAMCSAMANPQAIEKMFAGGFPPCTLLSVPLFHVSGCYAAFLLNLRGGRKTVVMYKWSPEQALKLISTEKVTIFSAAPSMVLELLRHPDFHSSDTSSLFSLGGGGAACPPSFKTVINNTLANAYIGTGYGMTESNAICANCSGEAFTYKPTSAGTLSPLVEWQTRDKDNNILSKGERGEIWLKSVCNVSHYWNKLDANSKQFDDGWMATGDIGYLDEENFVFVVDRAKDLIIRGGENIYPAEIEAILTSHPAVSEAAIIAEPDEQFGEIPAAVIRLRASAELNHNELGEYLLGKLAVFKHPKHIWFCHDELPRNAAGKVLKSELVQKYIA
ncbi:Long-chain-fatty-acid--CoA ligase FadD13 [Zhongshania aliphaticivorans]|uniref:Long-chain-fatty-acid--CoA ligase FadD13 n=1 Tax=Zhongshania aliphaticivorans TaxID=1470434 RepID=A0A5S9NW19_9GAMM|nr:class I adenylate-forming enzyme family protein [Zhongshania aliphaticivorans]CAA0088631.1 Long-chain-fatty-acid--CoA ligase FadD13 [Zhongshania aliphaticivorans]CAA0094792.1 Long-chain-fatty-acid--CoA ligase FadD13 [Zhongshania aliphaticivorans]